MRACSVLALVCLSLLLVGVSADVYLHHPRGSNDRLNEEGPGRNNGDRLFDSQNNNRGGYNVGSVQRIYYYEGTVVPVEWTQQHSCGDRNGNHCDLILQYSCSDKRFRDGEVTKTIPTDPAQCVNGDCDNDLTFGRHESLASYMNCRYRSRNKGLFTSNQRINGNSARFTRQNNNGGRSGLECPEERDYYPYHGPTMWRDAAIITTRPDRCAEFKAASQNVASRWYCAYDAANEQIAKLIANNKEGWLPITKEGCETKTRDWPGSENGAAAWTEAPAFGIPAPDCVEAPFTRDNHLGNAVPAPGQGDTAGYTAQYNWTVPTGINSPHCVLRLRYNISTGEFPFQGYDSATGVDASDVDSRMNFRVIPGRSSLDNNARVPSYLPIWEQYGLDFSSVNGSFISTRIQDDDPNNDNNGRDGGIKKAKPVSRDYTLRNNPQVDFFGALLPPRVSTDPELNGQPMIRTRLAVNTAQYGRTFQDRTHVFEIRARPASLQNVKIHNLSVRGKRGNIVQVYPGVEYDFVPDKLEMKQGEMVHIQWTGSSPQGGEGAGDKGDKSNLIMLRNRVYAEDGQDLNPSPLLGQAGRAYPGYINDTRLGPAFLGLDFVSLRALALYGINSSYFDLGPAQALQAGEYNYVCTRNNAFSNRSQKGRLIVKPDPAWVAKGEDGRVQAPMPVSLHGVTKSDSGRAALRQAYYDGTLLVPGSVTVADVIPGGAGFADLDSSWYRVDPPVMDLGVDKDMLWLELERPQPANFFLKGQMKWKLNADDEPIEIMPVQGFYGATNRFSVQNGGFYQSSSVPNTGMIAGVCIGVVALASLLLFAYWKVRVQPYGGWKAFWARNEAGGAAAEAGQMQELVPAGASSSNANRV